MRDVAEVARAPRFPPRDLGPLIPRPRTAVVEEEGGHLGGVGAAPEAEQGAEDAHLVGRVVVPVDLARLPAPEPGEVQVERALERVARYVVQEPE